MYIHTYMHILCGETHRDVYGVSSMENLTSVIVLLEQPSVCVGAVWLLQV